MLVCNDVTCVVYRFSGLTFSDLDNVTCTLRDVQRHLLKLFGKDSVLIGHSLESDLTAMKLCHSKVVDTSIMFPHRLGPPHKRALRNLAIELLQKIIQDDGE
jgi:RNA exonuclease 1